MSETKAVEVAPPNPYKFRLPIRYCKGEDDLGETEGVAGSIRDSNGAGRGYHLARIWDTGITNPDEFAELIVTAVNSYDSARTQVEELREALRGLLEIVNPALVSSKGAQERLTAARALLAQEEG